MNNYALVDLGSGRVERYDLRAEEMVAFLGNKGLATYILMKEMPQGVDPLGEENLLVFNTGVLTGTGAPTSGRFNASALSPLTGTIGTCNCGGDLGTFLKKAGYDGIIIRGKASGPVYLDVSPDGIEIKDARHLWGKDTVEAQAALGGGAQSGRAVIGPAGENLVRFSSVVSGHRVLGRMGLGAVMGSKHLKAVVARGDRKVPIGDPEKFKEVTRAWTALLKKHAITGYQLPKFGTAGLVNMTNATCTLPVRNFSRGRHADAAAISGEQMAEELIIKNTGCRFCPIRCGRWINLDGKPSKGPEYETISLMGSNLENFDLRSIARLSNECDRLGMDTISCGGVLGMAMELGERGAIATDLRFGRTDNLLGALGDIAHRRGLGDDLAEGTMRLSEKYGGADFAIHAKGLELAGYEPRRSVGQGLGYAVANRGGCHLNSGYLVFFEAVGPSPVDPLTTKGKPQLLVFQQNAFDALSSAGSCIFTAYAIIPSGAEEHVNPHGKLARVVSEVLLASGQYALSHQHRLPLGRVHLNIPLIPHAAAAGAAMGIEYGVGDFLLAGERVFTIDRMFNLREGFTKDDDALPARLTREPQDPGNPRTVVPLDKLVPEYFRVRGWGHDGIPTERLLGRLGLEWLSPVRAEAARTMAQRRDERLARRRAHDRGAREALKSRGGTA